MLCDGRPRFDHSHSLDRMSFSINSCEPISLNLSSRAQPAIRKSMRWSDSKFLAQISNTSPQPANSMCERPPKLIIPRHIAHYLAHKANDHLRLTGVDGGVVWEIQTLALPSWWRLLFAKLKEEAGDCKQVAEWNGHLRCCCCCCLHQHQTKSRRRADGDGGEEEGAKT